jgi:uncharacterized protein (TIGR00255 family)
MTGYGKAQYSVESRNVTVEVRSLNSKQADVNARLPYIYRDKELEIRSLLTQRLERGKIDLNINIEHSGNYSNFSINAELALRYKTELDRLSELLGQPTPEDIISIVVKLPEVLKNAAEDVDEHEWTLLWSSLHQSIEQLLEFREHEGRILEKDITGRIRLILDYLNSIQVFEKERIVLIREKMRKELHAAVTELKVDENRFEQELIYWFEKIDITEEKVRLKKHCSSFLNTLENEQSQGKKLGFITQEIGREINTIGSKANHAEIQTLVVQMKDELEKIKEQLLNIL